MDRKKINPSNVTSHDSEMDFLAGKTSDQSKLDDLKGFKTNVCYLSLFMLWVLINGGMQGYVQGYTTQAFVIMKAQYRWSSDGLYEGLIGGSTYLGLSIGAISGGKIVQRGRRRAVFIALAICFVGTGICLLEYLWAQLLGRVVQSIAAGLITVAVPRFAEENIPPHLYSTLSPIYTTSSNVGMLGAVILGIILPSDDASNSTLRDNQTWRILFGVPCVLWVISAIYLCLIIRMDTPKFYLMQETQEGEKMAAKAIAKIYRTESEQQVNQIVEFYRGKIEKKTSSITIKQAFVTDPKYVKASKVNVVHIIFHELTGINVINAYSNIILAQTTSGTSFTPRTGSIFIQCCQLFGALLFIPVLRTWGRRPLLLWGYFAIGVTHILIGVFDIIDFGILILVFLCLFEIFYQLSTGQIAWIYAAETLCDVSLGVGMYTLWFTSFILVLASPPMMNSEMHPYGVFFLFALFSLTAVIFVYMYLLETKDLTDKEKKFLYSPEEDESLLPNELENGNHRR